MAKKTPTIKPLEFEMRELDEEYVLLILGRETEDGFIGKARMVLKGSMTISQFGQTYEEMLNDFKADYPNEPLS